MKGYIYGFVGNAHLMKGNKELAISFFEKAIKYNTKNALSIYNYGLILLQDGDFQKALDLFLKSQEINGKKTKKSNNNAILLEKNIPLAIASSYWRLNDLDKAISTLEDLREKYDYVNPNTLTTLGYFYFLKQNYNKAYEITKLAINDDENFSPAWDNMGQIFLQQDDLDKAREYFKKAISISPKSVDSLYYLGIVEEKEGNKEKALQYFKKALDCNITSLNTILREDIEYKIKELS